MDGELQRYKGREKQLLREYEAEFSPAPGVGQDDTAGTSRRFGGVSTKQKSVVELAQEAEARRVEATLQASLNRIMSRKNNRR